MFNLAKGIDSLTSFKRDTSRYVSKLKKTGEAMVLTVNGKAEIVVQDAESYQKLLEQVQWAETLRVLQRSLEDIKAGRVSTLKDAKLALQKKLKVPPESQVK
jgi:PHD/YefM family antitoxin component YafN of YafNO toxin-antitoxin module